MTASKEPLMHVSVNVSADGPVSVAVVGSRYYSLDVDQRIRLLTMAEAALHSEVASLWRLMPTSPAMPSID